jgi:hypothetical protein
VAFDALANISMILDSVPFYYEDYCIFYLQVLSNLLMLC